MSADVLLIDNFDSFVFNLADALARAGAQVRVFRNDISVEEAYRRAQALENPLVVLSPGPGGPEDAGVCLDLIARCQGEIPLLGVCLGHQSLLAAAGAEVVRASSVVHGKASRVQHDGQGPFEGLPSPLSVARYHSLCVRDIPDRFTVHASLEGMAMGVSDPVAMQFGLQFHPESILTPEGDRMLRNIMNLSRRSR